MRRRYEGFRCSHCGRGSRFVHQAVRNRLDGIEDVRMIERNYICEACGRQTTIPATRRFWGAVDALYPNQTRTDSGPRTLVILS